MRRKIHREDASYGSLEIFLGYAGKRQFWYVAEVAPLFSFARIESRGRMEEKSKAKVDWEKIIENGDAREILLNVCRIEASAEELKDAFRVCSCPARILDREYTQT